jgi:catechol 2,3-dioxygenase-like lactoylglutathione lyase family enzyme
VLDHVRVIVSDLADARRFYERVLAPLGYRVWHESTPGLVGLGPADRRAEPRATMWLRAGEDASAGTLVSFTVADRATVDRFHAAGLEAGGADGGTPALRPFHADYYSAYVIDPAGVTLEAVCHRAP